jgi:AraC-like DNA-binding protein
MAHLPPPPLSSSSQKRGAYKLPERMRTMQDIRKLIIEGYPYDAIMEQLHIPHRTFYRYLSALFEDDRCLLAENVSDEEILNQMAITRDCLLEQRRNLLEMTRDPNIDPADRISAHHLIAEIAAAVRRIYDIRFGTRPLISTPRIPSDFIDSSRDNRVQACDKEEE